jgi:hypothetical protein
MEGQTLREPTPPPEAIQSQDGFVWIVSSGGGFGFRAILSFHATRFAGGTALRNDDYLTKWLHNPYSM